jgi:hypothetical protein
MDESKQIRKLATGASLTQQPARSASHQEETKQEYEVMVRHSPFMPKHLRVKANSVEEAKEAFIVEAKAQMDARAAKLKKQDDKDRAYKVASDALSRHSEFNWLIMTVEEANQKRQELEKERSKALQSQKTENKNNQPQTAEAKS